MTPLCELAKRYGTDKYDPHNYTPLYYRLLEDKRETATKVLEIGIAEGAKSLRMWEEFFPNAEIIGVDIDKRMQLNEGRVRSFVADQANDAEMKTLGITYGKFDVIVEDGSHKPTHQIAAMKAMLPFLADGGYYFMEDIWAPVSGLMAAVPQGYQCCAIVQSEKKGEGIPVHHMMVIQRADV